MSKASEEALALWRKVPRATRRRMMSTLWNMSEKADRAANVIQRSSIPRNDAKAMRAVYDIIAAIHEEHS